MNEMITGIWNNPYVQKLGIKDHCEEILEINRNIVAIKAAKTNAYEEMVNQLDDSLENEMTDLYLILQKRFEKDSERIQTRLKKFEMKAESNVIPIQIVKWTGEE